MLRAMKPPVRLLLCAALVLGAVLLGAYAGAFAFPFALDDWGKLNGFDAAGGWSEILRFCCEPRGRLFYRPLSHLSAALLHAGWPDQPAAYHVYNLFLLGLAAALAGAVAHALTGRRTLGVGVALLYAAATPIHLDTQLWMVGLNDLSVAGLTFAALLLHLRGRPLPAALTWGAALLFKEAAIYLPFVAAVASLIRLDHPPPARRALAWRTWGPYVAVCAVYALLKLAGQSPAGLEDSHPYALSIAPESFATRLGYYVRWLSYAACPALASSTGWLDLASRLFGQPALLTLLLTGGLLGTLVLARLRGGRDLRVTALAWWWLVAALAPVAPLANHAYRYYLLTALPAALLLALQVLEAALHPLARRRPRAAQAAFALLLTLAAGSGIAYARARLAEGLDQRFVEGTNELVRRGTATRLVAEQLPRLIPHPPAGGVIVFENLDVYGFGPSHGVRRWYRDPTLRAFHADQLTRDPQARAAVEQARADGRLHVVRWTGERLVEVAEVR